MGLSLMADFKILLGSLSLRVLGGRSVVKKKSPSKKFLNFFRKRDVSKVPVKIFKTIGPPVTFRKEISLVKNI